MIFRFKDKYSFLSNFYEREITVQGRKYKSVEHAYQAFKCKNFSEHEWIRNAPTANKAKSFGKKVKIRENWDELKYNVMLKLVRIKFSDDYMKDLLLETGEEELIEGNYWHDNEWGQCVCDRCKENETPKNWLGKILMIIRDEIESENDLFN